MTEATPIDAQLGGIAELPNPEDMIDAMNAFVRATRLMYLRTRFSHGELSEMIDQCRILSQRAGTPRVRRAFAKLALDLKLAVDDDATRVTNSAVRGTTGNGGASNGAATRPIPATDPKPVES